MSRQIPWFFPAECGDFTLIGGEGASTVLTVTDPTPADMAVLLPFLAHVTEKKWCDAPVIASPGETRIVINHPMRDVAVILAGKKHQDNATWTAIRSTGGEVTYTGGIPDGPVPDKAEALVTGQRVHRGCPTPTGASRRASRVLRAFSTARQWADWQARGYLELHAQRSRARYRIYHRDEAARLQLPRIAVQIPNGSRPARALCVWDWTIPPEEEALAVKLGLEHAEAEHVAGGFVTIPHTTLVRAGLPDGLPQLISLPPPRRR